MRLNFVCEKLFCLFFDPCATQYVTISSVSWLQTLSTAIPAILMVHSIKLSDGMFYSSCLSNPVFAQFNWQFSPVFI